MGDKLKDAINALRSAGLDAEADAVEELRARHNRTMDAYHAGQRASYSDGCRDGCNSVAAPPAPAAVPPGYALVPIEPTIEMVKRAMLECGGIGGGSCGEHTGVDGDDMRSVYSAMIAAAGDKP